VSRLSERKFDLTSPDLRDNILQFYSDLSVPIETKRDQRDWKSLLGELQELKAMITIPTVATSPAQ
jgi:hypothetical protein